MEKSVKAHKLAENCQNVAKNCRQKLSRQFTKTAENLKNKINSAKIGKTVNTFIKSLYFSQKLPKMAENGRNL